jgi:hypothetical protein
MVSQRLRLMRRRPARGRGDGDALDEREISNFCLPGGRDTIAL